MVRKKLIIQYLNIQKRNRSRKIFFLENKKKEGGKRITHLFLRFFLDGSQRFGVREVVNSDGQEYVQQDVCSISLVKERFNDLFCVCFYCPPRYFFRGTRGKKRIQLPHIKRMMKQKQASMPKLETPPYALMPSYITAFQSSPVSICRHSRAGNENTTRCERTKIIGKNGIKNKVYFNLVKNA